MQLRQWSPGRCTSTRWRTGRRVRVTPKNHSGAHAKTGQISYEMNSSRLTTHTGSNNLAKAVANPANRNEK